MVSGEPLRVVFFGTPEFAVPTLDALLRSRHSVVAVVTQPDRPRGRGQKTSDAPVKTRAIEAAVPVLQPATLVAAYGKILNDAVLATPRLGLINVHASLLPRHRGAAPVHRAIAAGDRETGVTIMRVVKALDAGPMMATARRPIGNDETSVDVERDLASIGAALLVATVDDLAAGRATETPQNEAEATYAHRLTKADGLIEWTRSADQIHNLVRGMHPWPHAFTFLDDARFIVHRSTWSADDAGEPGTIVIASGDDLAIAAGQGTLRVHAIQAEGKRLMHTREFLAGHRLSPGDRFSGPP